MPDCMWVLRSPDVPPAVPGLWVPSRTPRRSLQLSVTLVPGRRVPAEVSGVLSRSVPLGQGRGIAILGPPPGAQSLSLPEQLSLRFQTQHVELPPKPLPCFADGSGRLRAARSTWGFHGAGAGGSQTLPHSHLQYPGGLFRPDLCCPQRGLSPVMSVFPQLKWETGSDSTVPRL